MEKLILLTPLEGVELERFLDAFGPVRAVAVVRNQSELDAAPIDADTTLVSFGTGTIVPAAILSRLSKPAYNIHAAPPEFPGRDPHHHAVYRGASAYGATLHVMTAQVDAGPIIGVEMVPVPPEAKPDLLLRLASEAAMRLVERFGPRLLASEPPPAVAGIAWGAVKTRRADLLRLCRVTPDLDAAELDRRIRAFDVPGRDNLWLDFHGRSFRLDGGAMAAGTEVFGGPAQESVRSSRPSMAAGGPPDRASIPHSRPAVGGGEMEALIRVAGSHMLVGGEEPARFVRALGSAVQRESVFLFSSGRRALAVALAGLRLPAGTGVIVQTYVCDAVTSAIRQAGLVPQFCDVDAHWLSTPSTIARAVSPQTGALVLAPPFGLLQSAAPFRALGLPIIHDLCQASPATVGAAPPDSLGDLVVLSFHPTKYLCAVGGGAVIAASDRSIEGLAEASRMDADTAPISDLAAAFGCVQVARLSEFEARRASIAARYLAAIAGRSVGIREILDVEPGRLLRLPLTTDRDRQQVFARFLTAGIVARSGVDSLAHRQLGLADDRFPGAVRALETTVSLPFYPALADAEIERIAACAERFL